MDITVPLSDLQAFNVRSIVFNDVSNTIPTCFALDTWVIGSLYKITFRPIECFPNKIIRQVCYPKALYGCELWGELSKTETLMLERTHRYICKTILLYHKELADAHI
jgi:hypothetical protein